MSSVGNSISTILSRMGNIKLSRLKDYENNGEDLSNVETVLRGKGIRLRDSVNEFRDFSDVLDETAGKWKTFDSVSKRAIASAISGKDHMEDFLVLMENYNKATEYSQVAMDSAGTAMQKFGNYQQSLEAKQNKATASFEAFSSAILDSGIVGFGYDAKSGILGFLTDIIEKVGAIPALATAAAAALSFKNVGILNFDPSATKKISISDSFKSFFAGKQLSLLGEADALPILAKYEKAFASGADALRDFNQQFTNKGIQEYLKTVDNGKVSFEGYSDYIAKANASMKNMSLSAKAAAVGTKMLNMAINAGVIFLVSEGLNILVKGIDNLVHAQERAIETSHKITEAWKEQSDELKTAKAFISDNGAEFEKLSKGIDSLGGQGSLNTEEFERYKDIANQISNIFPSLVEGWTNEGNAILKTKTNIEDLTKAYEDAMRAQRDRVLLDAPVVLKGATPEISSSIGRINIAKEVQSILKSGDPYLDIDLRNLLFSDANKDNLLGNILSDMGFDQGLWGDQVKAFMEHGDALTVYIKSLESDLTTRLSELKPIPLSTILNSIEYKEMPDKIKSVVSSIASSFSAEWYSQLGGDLTQMKMWVQSNVLDIFSSADVASKITDVFSLKDAFESNNLTLDQYLAGISEFFTGIGSLAPEVSSNLEKALNVDTGSMVERAKSLLQDEFNDMVGSLTLEDLTIAYKLENVGNLSFDQLLALIAKTKETTALSLDSLASRLSSLNEAQSTANEVLSAQSDVMSISVENYDKLIAADEAYADAVDSSSGYMAINAQKLRDLNATKAQALYADVKLARSNALAEYVEINGELAQKTRDLAKAQSDASDEGIRKQKDINDEIDQLKIRRDKLGDSIEGYNRITSELQDATGAYRDWINAQNAPNDSDMYDGMGEALKTLKEGLESGRVGTEEFQAALKLMVPEEFRGSIEDITKYLKTLEGYFTEDNTGVTKFVKKLDELNLAKFDPKTKQFELFENNLQTIADATGLTVDDVMALLKSLNDYSLTGDIVKWTNPEIEVSPAELEAAAQKAIDDALANGTKGNVSFELEARPKVIVDEKNIDTVRGWGMDDAQLGDTMTYASQTFTSESGKSILITPILPSGQLLTQDALEAYVDKLLDGGDDSILTNDTLGLIIGTFENGNVDQTVEEADKLAVALHNLHEAQLEVASSSPEIEPILSLEEQVKILQDELDKIQALGLPAQISVNIQDEISRLQAELTESGGVGVPSELEDSEVVITAKDEASDVISGVSDKAKKTVQYASDNPVVVQVDASQASNTQEIKDAIDSAVQYAKDHPVVSTVHVSQDDTTHGGKTGPSFDNGAKPAYDSGRPPIAKRETALVAEKRPEIFVRDGKYSILSSPQLLNLKPGDQIIGGEETSRILRGGASKTGRAHDGGIFSKIASSVSKVYSSVSSWFVSSSGSTKADGLGNAKKKSKNTFDLAAVVKQMSDMMDWVQIALEKAKVATENFIKDAGRAVGYISQNLKLDAALSSVKKEIATNEQAYNAYMAQADKVASETRLSSDIISKVQNGDISVGSYDEATRNAIKLYQDWYEKAQSVKSTLDDLADKQDEIGKQRLDNIIKYYDNLSKRVDAQVAKAQKKLDLKGATGQQVNATDYLDTLDQAQAKIALITQERAALNAEFTSLVASGVIKKDSDAWHKYTGELENLDDALIDAQIDLADFKREMADVDITNLGYALSKFQQIQDALQNLISLNEAQGSNGSAESYTSLISNAMSMIANMEQQNALLRAQLVGLDVLSEKYQDIQSKINDNTNTIMQTKTAQEQWNDAVHDLKIKSIQDQKDALNKVNAEYKRQLEMQQALEDLQKAQQRRNLILKDGKFVYEANQSDIKKAQDRVDELRHNELIATLEKEIDAIEDLKKSDNVYDSLGNLIPKYDTGTPRTTEGYAYLHDNEMILNPNGVEGLWKLLNSQTAMDAMLGNAIKDMNRYTAYVNAPAPSNAIPSFNIENIEMHEVNDANTFVKEMLRHVPNQIAQQLHQR